MKQKTVALVQCALFAALTGVLSQVSIPIGPVPLNLATFSVLLAGSVLGARYGAVSQAIFTLLGVVGLPVFAGMKGGAAVLAGPTGGYIIGYIATAWLVGLLARQFGKSCSRLAVFMVAGMLLCYTFGTAWFLVLTKMEVRQALAICVFPFLIGDAVKVAAAALVAPRLYQTLSKNGLINPNLQKKPVEIHFSKFNRN